MDKPWSSAPTSDVFGDEEQSFGERLLIKTKKSPFLMAGIVGFFTICGIGAYKWKTRTVNASLYLTQLRVVAQGTAVGFFALGMTYQMLQDFVFKDKEQPKKN